MLDVTAFALKDALLQVRNFTGVSQWMVFSTPQPACCIFLKHMPTVPVVGMRKEERTIVGLSFDGTNNVFQSFSLEQDDPTCFSIMEQTPLHTPAEEIGHIR